MKSKFIRFLPEDLKCLFKQIDIVIIEWRAMFRKSRGEFFAKHHAVTLVNNVEFNKLSAWFLLEEAISKDTLFFDPPQETIRTGKS